MNERKTLRANKLGHLEIGGCDCLELAKEFGTPLYVFDEEYIRAIMRAYKGAIDTEYGGYGKILYASKAFSCLAVYKIAREEGVGCDAVSGGELFTALTAGFNVSDIFVHGNNKTYEELCEAVDAGVGAIVIDSFREADILNELCAKKGVVQNVLIRVNPGVEAHTHSYVQTARTDSKFGFAVEGGFAKNYAAHVLELKNINLKGFHCHIGSQIFEKEAFCIAARKMLNFIADVKRSLGFEAEILNLGGGFGVYYTDDDPKMKVEDYADYVKTILSTVKEEAAKLNLSKPYVVFEPGRSIVGEAGITLYTVGSIKDIPNVKKYVAVDGGMYENPRYALYQAKYSAVKAADVSAPCVQKVSLAGKCCESGDILAADMPMPQVESGDVIAVFTTGAYHYSMAGNYNRNLVPEAVLVRGGKAEVIIKRQTYKDLIRNDVIPDYLK